MRARCLGLIALVAFTALANFVTGCTPSAERVCGRKMRLSEDRFGKLDPASRKKGFAHCIELAKEEQRVSPAKYKCRANCVLDGRKLDEVMECDKSCG